MKNYLTFGGKSTADFNVWISGGGTFDAPERDVSMISVPGRDGDLTVDNGRFKNVEMTYPAFITKDFKRNMAGFRQYMKSLIGYQRLEDTYHPEYFYQAVLSKNFAPEPTARNLASEFEISFNRKPQRWLKSGERWTDPYYGPSTIYNPTLFTAKPIIRVYGTGTFQINGTTIEILQNTVYIDIDSELQDCYYGLNNLNDKVVLINGVFPTLASGTNGISLGTGISSISIKPCWWEL